MLTLHLFSRNIKTQNRLPMKWLNVTFNIIKVNSSSSNSSSDSDSDSDSEPSNKNKLINEDDTTKSTSLKHTDYLHVSNEKHKKREFDRQLHKVVDVLSNIQNNPEKEKILSNILYTISPNNSNTDYPSAIKKIQKTSRNAKYQPRTEMEEGSSIIKQLKREQEKLWNAKHQPRTEMEEESSIIKQLKREQEKLKNAENQPRTEMKNEPSIIKQLKREQKKLWNAKYQPRTEMEEEPSIIKQIQFEQEKLKHMENQYREGLKKEPSIIKQIQYERSRYNANKYRRVETAPSIIRQIQREEQKFSNAENQPKTGMKERLSKIKRTQYDQQILSNDKSQKDSITSWLVKHAQNEEISTWDKTSQECGLIFTAELLEMDSKLKIWDICEKREMQILMVRNPRNAFEELINWTDNGIIWRFPIDNEQGLETEKDVHFSKHVFLDQNLAGWCPTKGPIRQFMELVCVGLSKNPYMTVQEKTDHIMWYKDYFENKRNFLEKLGLTE